MPPRSALFPYTTLFRSWLPSHTKCSGFKDSSPWQKEMILGQTPVHPFSMGPVWSWPQYSIRRATSNEAPATVCISGLFLPRNRSEEHTSELQSLTNLVCRLDLHSFPTRRSSDLGFQVIQNALGSRIAAHGRRR